MKKNFIILSAVVLALVSCNKQESRITAERVSMDISPVVGIPTTRGVITGTDFPERPMVVSADLNSSTGSSSNYFTNVTFSYSGGVWAPATTYYWPLSGGLELLAYSAGSASVTPTWTNATAVSLVCSDCTADDILMGGATNATPSNKSVAFKHCLAQVNVKAAAANSASTAIKIKSVAINAKKGATLAISKSAGSAATSVSTTPSGSAADISVFSGSQALTTTSTAVGSALLLPAQQTPGSIKIGYTITNGSTESATMYVTKTLSTALTAGNAYTYTITATLTGITVTATLSDWADGGSTGVTI